MKLKVNISKQDLAPEGVAPAKVRLFKEKGENKCTAEFEVTIEGKNHVVSRDYGRQMDPGSPLLRDVETLLGTKFTKAEEFDFGTLVGKPCEVVIVHKKTSGGRLAAVVTTVLPAPTPEPTAMPATA